MNLTQLFNFKYLVQNLKKSKGPLAVFIGFIPVLNVIIFLLMAQSNKSTGLVPTIELLSIINFVGMYVIPVVLSLSLFGFIFKKKSVDFVNSMPLNRTVIFVTNAIGGICILLTMVLVNVLLIGLLSLIFPHIYIPVAMLFDYFVIWSITYIFVFMAANIATALAGNGITQLVITALLLFLTPFIYDYTTIKTGTFGSYIQAQVTCKDEACQPIQYLCYEDTKCELDRSLNIYYTYLSSQNEATFTAPYGVPRSMLFGLFNGSFKLYNGGQLLRMLILSFIYFFVGLFAFKKRKMEVSETSFKSIDVHNIVKCLTLIPIGFAVFEIFSNEGLELIPMIFVLTLILIYYFIYDLITKRSITQLSRGLITFVIASVVILSYAGILDTVGEGQQYNKFEVGDIEAVSVSPKTYDYSSDAERLESVFIKNKELINLVMKNMLTTEGYWEYNKIDYNDAEMKNPNVDYETMMREKIRFELNVTIKNKNGKEYTTTINTDEDSYNRIIEILSSDKEYMETFRELDYDSIYAVTINQFSSKAKNSQEVIGLIKEGINKSTLKDYFANFNSNFLTIELYTYKNHRVETYRVSAAINKELHQKIINTSNEQLKAIINSEDFNYYSSSIWLEDSQALSLNNDFDYDKLYYIIDNSHSELLSFINKNMSNQVDINKPYVVFNVYFGRNYRFYTNNIDELENLIIERLEYLETTEDYNNIYNPKYYYQ